MPKKNKKALSKGATSKTRKPAATAKRAAAVKAPKLYKIESGIVMPEPVVANGDGMPSRVFLTMKLLEVGQSFLIADELEAMKAARVVKDSNSRLKGEKKFAMRKMKKGARVWRVK